MVLQWQERALGRTGKAQISVYVFHIPASVLVKLMLKSMQSYRRLLSSKRLVLKVVKNIRNYS